VKAAAFALESPATVEQAAGLLARSGAMPMAGGQSLGPMLNLRLARPEMVVRLAGIGGLAGVRQDADSVTIGALVTHAAIADGRTPDPGQGATAGLLARVAEGIAYRAVRNRGTIGGSLCHADPAADWVTVLTALDATALTTEGRAVPVADFIAAAFRTVLRPGELLRAVRIPRLSADARWGYVKACRKPGEFAHAMAAVLTTGTAVRLVIGATGGRPLLLRDPAALGAALAGLDPVVAHIQSVIAARALAQAQTPTQAQAQAQTQTQTQAGP
jgi:carbon-monoxide dehydrogenase medium subunit